jgi:hypothetical protein
MPLHVSPGPKKPDLVWRMVHCFLFRLERGSTRRRSKVDSQAGGRIFQKSAKIFAVNCWEARARRGFNVCRPLAPPSQWHHRGVLGAGVHGCVENYL